MAPASYGSWLASGCAVVLSSIRAARRGLPEAKVASFIRSSLLAACCWLCLPAASSAMTIKEADLPRGSPPMFLLNGEIVVGDFDRLVAVLEAVGSRSGLASLDVDSPGGNILEADRLATLIRRLGLAVSVADGEECASACFLLFAASRHRAAASGARIGVHSASMFGDENLLTLDVTAYMAREAATFGVPPSVLGRMITTTPSDMAWLTNEELRQMDVTREDTPLPVRDPQRAAVVETPQARRGEVEVAPTTVNVPLEGEPRLAETFSYRAGDARGVDLPTPKLLNERRTSPSMAEAAVKEPGRPAYVPKGPATEATPVYAPGS